MKDALSLNGVTVKMDTSKEHPIKALLKNGNYLVFNECNYGLHHLNINDINKDVMYYSCPKTFNKKQISHAGKLREQKKTDFTTENWMTKLHYFHIHCLR